MWFNKDDVNIFLSKQAKAFLNNDTGNDLWNNYALQTEEFIKNIATIDENNIPDSFKLPFVWLFEYLLQNQFSGQSQDYINLVSEHYKEAIKFFGNLEDTRINSAEPKVSNFNNAYNLDNV